MSAMPLSLASALQWFLSTIIAFKSVKALRAVIASELVGGASPPADAPPPLVPSSTPQRAPPRRRSLRSPASGRRASYLPQPATVDELLSTTGARRAPPPLAGDAAAAATTDRANVAARASQLLRTWTLVCVARALAARGVPLAADVALLVAAAASLPTRAGGDAGFVFIDALWMVVVPVLGAIASPLYEGALGAARVLGATLAPPARAAATAVLSAALPAATDRALADALVHVRSAREIVNAELAARREAAEKELSALDAAADR